MISGKWLAILSNTFSIFITAIAIVVFIMGMAVTFKALQFRGQIMKKEEMGTIEVRQVTPKTIEKHIVTDRLTEYTIDFTPCKGLEGGIIFLNDLTKTITCGTIKDVDK